MWNPSSSQNFQSNSGNRLMKTMQYIKASLTCLGLIGSSLANAGQSERVQDLNYGVVLYEFYQQHYFNVLVEYDYAAQKGGIKGHGNYPEVLKGGVSLSYGLSNQAEEIFDALIEENLPEQVRNRAWFYMAKMRYLKGEHAGAQRAIDQITDVLDDETQDELVYLTALNANSAGEYQRTVALGNSASFEESQYAPYVLYNQGIAQAKLENYEAALNKLDLAVNAYASFYDDNLLADRGRMAIAYLASEHKDFRRAGEYLSRVTAEGVFSNEALLSHGWLALNQGKYAHALTPLKTLYQRSIVIPEVQESVLLVPQVYERLGLNGRAARGFIEAEAKYATAIDSIEKARDFLNNNNMLEAFVSNLDELLLESDWFGNAPSVAINEVSPFVLTLMSDHVFQSTMKDLRDLYAIRNNLQYWHARVADFDLILTEKGLDREQRSNPISSSSQHSKLQAEYDALQKKLSRLPAKQVARFEWMLRDIEDQLVVGAAALSQSFSSVPDRERRHDFSVRVSEVAGNVMDELYATNNMIAKLETIIEQLVESELDTHQKRIEYFTVQAKLAKTRIMDRNLLSIDPAEVSDGDEELLEISQEKLMNDSSESDDSNAGGFKDLQGADHAS